MALLFKILFLQLFWFICVIYGPEFQNLIFLGSIFIVIANWFLFKPNLTKSHYIFFIVFSFASALFIDWVPLKLNLVDYNQDSFPLWLSSMYILFVAYYGDIFNKFSKWKSHFLFAIGFVGGCAAYYSGGKLAGLSYYSKTEYFGYIGLCWGTYFWVSMRIFYDGFIWNKILDASIVYSFDKTGFDRHKKTFQNEALEAQGKYLITGGTSGIGLACALGLKKYGAEVFVTGRNKQKGDEVSSANNLLFFQLDMEDWDHINYFVKSFEGELKGLVLNAGGMPENFQTNKYGVESQMASQFFGHYLLLKEFHQQGKLAKGARVVWVSSGGMYLKNLDLNVIFLNDKYDKVATYANVKRMQVTYLKDLKHEFSDLDIVGMHPGWVDTPGLREAITDFFEKMKNVLRSPHEGADTIVWLLLTKKYIRSGGFYFDRKLVSTHYFPHTLVSEFKRKKLRVKTKEIISLGENS